MKSRGVVKKRKISKSEYPRSGEANYKVSIPASSILAPFSAER